MNHDERVRRLRAMLSQVADNGIESLATPTHGIGFESVAATPDAARAKVDTALQKLAAGASISPDEAFGLEAIVMVDKRPVVFIRNNKFANVAMTDWAHLNQPAIHARLEPLFTSIGRIELPTTPSIPYGGTGFVVGKNLLMTNRHVARLFTDGLGTQLTYHPNGSAVDFKREEGDSETDTSRQLKVTGVVMIHPFWDMALLKVAGLPESAKPLALSVQTPEALEGHEVVVVGYPARDYRNDLAVQDRIFENKYGVKRMQPGKTRPREKVQSFENRVNALVHDSSTLGGNSGSAVLAVETGQVLGLHFGGEYLKANYAVPAYELARDSRVVDAGVNFVSKIPSSTETDSAWQRVGAAPTKATEKIIVKESGKPQKFVKPPDDQQVQQQAVVPGPDGRPIVVPVVGLGDNQPTTAVAIPMPTGMTFVVPLQISVAIGGPMAAMPVQQVISAQAVAATEIGVEKVPVVFPSLGHRGGYKNNFLGLSGGRIVPIPQLTAAGRAVVAKTEGGSPVLNYHRFSVVVHKIRRLAMFTAANVDWRTEKRKIDGRKPTRKELDGFTGGEQEDWITDPRIPFDHQLPDYFYTKDDSAFDKGHLVRRDDVAWGDSFEDMQKGNGDTFHTTNCSPQTADFNRAKPSEFNWGALENMVQQQTNTEKVCVFSGPVLSEDDGYFHGLVKSGVEVSIQIPSKFWKIIVASEDGEPAAYGFVLDQDLAGVDLYTEMTVPDAWKQYMRSIGEIEGYLNGWAKLGHLKDWDQFEG